MTACQKIYKLKNINFFTKNSEFKNIKIKFKMSNNFNVFL